MVTLVERLAIVITGESVGGVNAFKAVGAASEEATAKMSVAQRASGMLQSKIGGIGAAVGAGLAADVAAFKFGEHLVNEFANATSAVRAFQRVTGGTAEDSSRLVAAFRVLGLDTDKVGTAVFRLAKNVDGSQAALEKHGIVIAKNAAGGVDLTNTFLNIADAVHKVGAGFEADSIVAAAFGARVGKDLLPVLLRGREGLQELFDAAKAHHEIFSQSDLEAGRQFTLATNELHAALTGLEIQGGKTLVPLATGLTKTVESITRVPGLFTVTTGAVEGMLGPLGTAIEFFGRHKNAQVDLAASAKQAADAITEQENAVKAATSAVKEMDSADHSLLKAQESLADSHKSVARAQRDEADAQQDLDALRAKTAVDADKVTQAEQRLADASLATARAQRAESDAAKTVADAKADQLEAQRALDRATKAAPDNQRKAELSLVDAKRAQERATLAVEKAEKARADSFKDANATVADREGLWLDLVDAQEQVEKSAIAVREAEAQLADTQDAATGVAKTVTDAQKVLADKTDALTKATQGQADAHTAVATAQREEQDASTELTKAQAGDPEFKKTLREAEQRLADAHDSVATAKRNERDATDELTDSQGALNTALAETAKLQADLLAKEPGAFGRAGPGADTAHDPSLAAFGRAGPGSDATGGLLRAAANGQSAFINSLTVNVSAGSNAQGWQIAEAVRDEIARINRRNGLN